MELTINVDAGSEKRVRIRQHFKKAKYKELKMLTKKARDIAAFVNIYDCDLELAISC